MQFKETQAIYLQIAEFIEEKIIRGEWKADERIPSARDLAVSMEVNPNTIVKTFEILQQKNIIYNKRGIGYFVAENAKKSIIKEYKSTFIRQDIPAFFKTASLLNFSVEEITALYQEYLQQQSDN